MNKRSMLLITLVVLILIFGWIYLTNRESQISPPSELSSSPPNWTNLPKTIDSQGEVLYKNEASYQIYFSPQTNRYTIALFGSPLNEVLQEAEQGFLDLLQIPPQQACQLSVYIATPVWFDPEEPYESFSLSFCRTASPTSTPSASLIP